MFFHAARQRRGSGYVIKTEKQQGDRASADLRALAIGSEQRPYYSHLCGLDRKQDGQIVVVASFPGCARGD